MYSELFENICIEIITILHHEINIAFNMKIIMKRLTFTLIVEF